MDLLPRGLGPLQKGEIDSLGGGDPASGQGWGHGVGDDGVVCGCRVLLCLKEGAHLLQCDVFWVGSDTCCQLEAEQSPLVCFTLVDYCRALQKYGYSYTEITEKVIQKQVAFL